MNRISKILALTFVVTPVIASAQLSGISRLITALGNLIGKLTIIVAAIALLVFFWGLVRFIFKIGGSEEAVKEGRTLMIWGLIALFVLITVWGLVNFIRQQLEITQVNSPTLPFVIP